MRPDLLMMNLPAIILLGLFTSYTDIAYGKIRNKHCVWGIIYGILTLAIASLVFYFTGEAINPRYYLDFLINFLVGSVIAVVVWGTGLLSAGDLKLFLMYSVLVPLSVYRYGYVNLFPASTILVNTFVPMFVFLCFYILLRTDWRQKWGALRSTMELKKLGPLALATFGFSWIISLVLNHVSFIPRDYFTIIILIFIIILLSERLLGLRFVWLCLVLAVARLVFDFSSFLTIGFYLSFLFLFVSMLLLRFFILELAKDMFKKEIGLEELRAGMILAGTYGDDNGGKTHKEERVYYDFLTYLQERELGGKGRLSRQLTREDVEFIKHEYKKRGWKNQKLKIHSTIPFAPFMFLGVVITILAQGDLFGAVSILIRSILS